MEKQNNPSEKNDSKFKGLGYYMTGEFIEKFISMKYLFVFMMIFSFAMLYIWNRYESQRQMTQIATLKKEIRELRYRSVTHTSEVLGQGRQSQIKRRLKELGVEMEESNTPPYLLKR
ncbi:MAG: FtsL-like putative cell division protein [Bacteroidales bacterium]